jgi:hypothetical protein
MLTWTSGEGRVCPIWSASLTAWRLEPQRLPELARSAPGPGAIAAREARAPGDRRRARRNDRRAWRKWGIPTRAGRGLEIPELRADRSILLALAYRMPSARLIDNVVVHPPGASRGRRGR